MLVRPLWYSIVLMRNMAHHEPGHPADAVRECIVADHVSCEGDEIVDWKPFSGAGQKRRRRYPRHGAPL